MSKTIITEQIIFEEIKKIIAETLRVDENSIKLDTSLTTELDAESLDFLDINYQLEQKFGIKMARHFVLEHIEDMFGEGSAIDKNSKLTDKAIKVLKIRFGDNIPILKPGLDMDNVPTIITPISIVKAVMDMLATLPEKCSFCGKETWETEKKTRLKCGSCGESAALKNGDDLTSEWLTKIQEEKKIFHQ